MPAAGAAALEAAVAAWSCVDEDSVGHRLLSITDSWDACEFLVFFATGAGAVVAVQVVVLPGDVGCAAVTLLAAGCGMGVVPSGAAIDDAAMIGLDTGVEAGASATAGTGLAAAVTAA